MSRSWKIDRRTFLRGAAGALLPLPFLNLMEGKVSNGLGKSGFSNGAQPTTFAWICGIPLP